MNPLAVVSPLAGTGLAGGTLLVALGLLVLYGRGAGRNPSAFVRRLSEPTRLAAGVALLVVGYHLVAWSLPVHWLPIRAPARHWWAVLGLAVVLVTGSAWADRLEGRHPRDGG